MKDFIFILMNALNIIVIVMNYYFVVGSAQLENTVSTIVFYILTVLLSFTMGGNIALRLTRKD